MQYVFGFDLKYKKYKKDFRCTIHLDDMMLDDFVLDDDKHLQKIYIVDIDNLEQIKITNHCEDSNYVNGFQSKTATYQFDEFVFAPADLLNHNTIEKIKHKKWRTRERKYPDYWTNPEYKQLGEPKEILEKLDMSDTWPVFVNADVHHTYKDFKETGLRLQGTVFTESTQIKINVKKKHKILMSLPVKNYGNIEVATRGAKKWINIYNENS
jgi:hypothetical protein